MLNQITHDKLDDGSYVLGVRPTVEKDGIPLFIFDIVDGKFQFNVNTEVRDVFEKSIEFILRSGDWCTLKSEDNDCAKYLIVAKSEF